MRSTTFLVLCTLRLDGFQNLLEKARLRHCAHNFNAVVHDSFRDPLHPIELGHVDELGDFDHIGGDMLVFNG